MLQKLVQLRLLLLLGTLLLNFNIMAENIYQFKIYQFMKITKHAENNFLIDMFVLTDNDYLGEEVYKTKSFSAKQICQCDFFDFIEFYGELKSEKYYLYKYSFIITHKYDLKYVTSKNEDTMFIADIIKGEITEIYSDKIVLDLDYKHEIKYQIDKAKNIWSQNEFSGKSGGTYALNKYILLGYSGFCSQKETVK